jgi:hypothetical protein
MDTTRPYREGGYERRVQYLEVDVNNYTTRQAPDPNLVERLIHRSSPTAVGEAR